jgi:hypothetical protein
MQFDGAHVIYMGLLNGIKTHSFFLPACLDCALSSELADPEHNHTGVASCRHDQFVIGIPFAVLSY